MLFIAYPTSRLKNHGNMGNELVQSKAQRIELHLVAKEENQNGIIAQELTQQMSAIEKTKMTTTSSEYLNIYYEQLRNYIEAHQVYPQMALRLKQQGKVLVRLLIEKNGRFKQIILNQTSGHELLDKSVIENLKTLNQFKEFPKEIAEPEIYVNIPIVFETL